MTRQARYRLAATPVALLLASGVATPGSASAGSASARHWPARPESGQAGQCVGRGRPAGSRVPASPRAAPTWVRVR